MRLPFAFLVTALLWLPTVVVAAAVGADPYDQSGVALEVDSKDPALKKVVLLAGDPSSKPMGHEYFAGCALFAKWLKEVPGVHPVMVKGGWPKNEKILEGASSIVFYMDGGPKIPFLDEKRWAKVQALEKQGVGMVFLHQMVDFPPERRAEALAWVGALFENGKGGRGHWKSDFEHFSFHPVANGLSPFSIDDGWLYGYELVGDHEEKLMPILVTVPPESSRKTEASKARAGQEEMIAWTYERKNGGRSFAFSAADWHPNWEVESVRRVVVNAILWTAGVPVPKKGALVSLLKEELNRNLDDKRKSAPAGKTRINPNVTYLSPASMEGLVLDDLQGEMKGSWTGSSTSGPVIVGRSYFHDGNKNKGEASVSFRPKIGASGEYEFFLYAQPHGNRSQDVPVTVSIGGNTQTVRVNQRDPKSQAKHSLGSYQIKAGQNVTVEVSNKGTKGIVVVDALQVVRR